MNVVDPGVGRQVLAQPQHQLHDPAVGLDVGVEDLVLLHLDLAVPGAPAGDPAELERVDPRLHLLEPLPQEPYLQFDI